MQEINQQETEFLQKIADSIYKVKNLKILNLNDGRGSFGSIFIVEDNLTKIQYNLKVISIFDGYNDICQEKLDNAKKEADFLKQCSHPNIVKYIDQFKIDFNYFILTEKYEQTLEQWILNKNKAVIQRHQLISFACQILSAIQFFHENNYVLRDLSLKNILIDRYNRIKICDFGLAQNVYSELCSQKFLASCSKDEMFYFPPELINQSKEQISNNKGLEQNYQSDIWAFGIYFSILGGAIQKECLSIHISGYTYIKQLDEDFNQILSKVLSLQPNQRPSIQQTLKEFEVLKQKIWNPIQASILFTEYQQIHTDDIQKALETILICVDISPENIQYQFHQANIWHELKYFDEAIKSYQKCLEINPKDDICHNSLGDSYYKKGMPKEALKSFLKCLQNNPKNDKCYFNIGDTLSSIGKVKDAIKQYEKGIELNPKNDIYHFKLGSCYKKIGMVKEAIKSYQKCIEINPNNDIYHFNLASSYKEKDMVDETIKSYQKCIEINPNNDVYHYKLAISYKKNGMLNEAIKSYQRCLEINPKDDKCCFNLGTAYEDNDMADEAIKQYKKICLEINPKTDKGYYNLGLLYYKKGMLNESIYSYQKHLDTNPKDDKCHFYLGNRYLKKDRVDEAIKSYLKCQKLNPSQKTLQQIENCKKNI